MTGLIGIILPPFIDLVNKHIQDKRIKFLVSLLVCIVLGIMLEANKLKYSSAEDILGSIALVFASAQTSYRLYWKGSTLRGKFK